jgi:hypothetical protein
VGGIVGGVSGVGASDAWRETYAAVREERVVVGYHSEDPGDVDVAEKRLREHDPVDLARYGPEGSRIS